MNVALLSMIFVHGLAAGICFDVATVKLPTRRRIGAVAYAHFARGNDLGNGLKVYPFLVGGGGLLLVALAVVAQLTAQPERLRYPLFAAALAAIGCLAATAKAAPIMLSLKSTPDDAGVLGEKLDRFAFWHAWRTAFQLCAFAALLGTRA